MAKSKIKWHFCDAEQPKKTGSYLVSSKRNPGRVFQSRYYAPQTWSNGHRLAKTLAKLPEGDIAVQKVRERLGDIDYLIGLFSDEEDLNNG